ncbi:MULTISPECIES: hypothetical protein [Snodgrassella]|uniref:hypothetical protein n=1 Tax=Snodgrassella TaxID=1193515 RepID=UPI0015841251|nr:MULTISPECIES: hypothetical protein [Snodgrassella]NUE67692.1 hypothetical protein [Snodgrassella sp. ESL0253]WMY91674.1 hypothetical protein PYG29_09615 [Snodgrassella communis]
MKKIEDVGLGDIKILEYGNDISFELTSVYNNGETIGEIICKNVKYISIKNDDFDAGDGFQGSYIPIIIVQNLDNILTDEQFIYFSNHSTDKIKGYMMTFGEFSIQCKVICLDIIFNISEKFKDIIIDE